MASFGDLNEDILISIFKFLEVVELFKYSIVCKRWNRVIGNSNLLWKRFVPKCDSFDLPFNKNPKVVVELIYRRSEKFEGEYWYPDAFGELENRDSELRGMLLTKDPNADEYAGFKLFARLNPIYDLINGCKYSKIDLDQNVCNKAGKEKPTSACFGFVKALWKEFNQENQSDIVAETLESEKDVWNKSYVTGARHFLYLMEQIFEPEYLYDHGVRRSQRRDLKDVIEGYVSSDEEQEDQTDEDDDKDAVSNDNGSSEENGNDDEATNDVLEDEEVIENEESDDQQQEEQVDKLQEYGDDGSFESYLRRFYEPPRLELLRDMIKIMFGPEGHGSVRVFYLSEGCFNENFSEAYFLYVGKNAAFYRRVSYDL